MDAFSVQSACTTEMERNNLKIDYYCIVEVPRKMEFVLSEAVKSKNMEATKDILHKGKIYDFNINDALYYATKTQMLNFVNVLLEDERLNQWTDNLASIFKAIELNNETILEALIKQIDYSHNYSETILAMFHKEIARLTINSTPTIKNLVTQIPF